MAANALTDQFKTAYNDTWGTALSVTDSLTGVLGADAAFFLRAALNRAQADGNLCIFEQGPTSNASLALSYFRTTTATGPGGAIRIAPGTNERDSTVSFFSFFLNATDDQFVLAPVLVRPMGSGVSAASISFIREDTQEALSTPAELKAAVASLFRFSYPASRRGGIPNDGLDIDSSSSSYQRIEISLGIGLGVGLGMLGIVILLIVTIHQSGASLRRLVELDPSALQIQDDLVDLPSHLIVPSGGGLPPSLHSPLQIAMGRLKTGLYQGTLVIVQELPSKQPEELPPSDTRHLSEFKIPPFQATSHDSNGRTRTTASSDSVSVLSKPYFTSSVDISTFALSAGAFRRASWQHQAALLLRFRNHANILSCLGLVDLKETAIASPARYALVYENAWRLRRILRAGLPAECKMKRRVAWIRELVSGLQHIASGYPPMPYGSEARWVLRYGIRLGNLFVDTSGTLKICLTIDDSEHSSSFLRSATAVFSAPEVRAGESGSEASDVWFVGCLGWLLLCGYDEDTMIMHVLAARSAFEATKAKRLELPWSRGGSLGRANDEEPSEELASVLKRCTSADPSERPSFKELMWATAGSKLTSKSNVF